MVRVRKKCIGLAGQKMDGLRHRGELSSSASQNRKDSKRTKEFQGKLSHSSPPVTRSCSLTHVAENKKQDVTNVCDSNEPVFHFPVATIKQEFEPNLDSDVKVVAVISWQSQKTIPIRNPLQCSTLRSNPKTDFLESKSQIVLQSNESVCCVDQMFTHETLTKSESNLELNLKRELKFEKTFLKETETLILPEGLDKVEIEIEVETSIESCAPTLSAGNVPEKLISPTPHKIQICNEHLLTQSPSSALSSLNSLSISQTPKKAVKSSRKLHPSQVSNQQFAFRSSRPKQSEIIKQVIATNHKIDEYYPIVRRSNRKTKRTIFEEKQLELEQAIREEREEGLEVHNFEGKGRGVVTTRPFSRGEFVVEYSGELIDLGEAKLRETLYTHDQNTGCYMYYFRYRNHQYCIDATSESGRLGRLVNHSRINGNLITKTVLVENKPHLVLLAKEDIPAGEEIMYDYGDRSKESLRHHPWLKC